MFRTIRDLNLKIGNLGEPKIDSPMKAKSKNFKFTGDHDLIYADMRVGSKHHNEDTTFERAGAREKLFFDPKNTKVAIVTCGGLCPGLNDVIHNLVLTLHHWYGVKNIFGIRFGYSGLGPNPVAPPINLDLEEVAGIHHKGGTILGSARGRPTDEEMVDKLVSLGVNILIAVGGDGTFRGAHAIAKEAKRRNLPISIIGVPKTIDNDIPFVYRSFGFQTAVEEAKKVLDCAHVESTGAHRGVGLVKLMGRDAGFIAAYASRASGDVNCCLVPEINFPLHGDDGLLSYLRERLDKRKHAVIAVAEGAGQHLLGTKDEKDGSGNVKYQNIGLFLKGEIEKAFKRWDEEVHVKYFDPTYIVRSVPANSEDSIFCADLARYAIDAAMAGKTDMFIGHWHGEFTHVPFKAIQELKKRIHTDQKLWLTVLETTGQPFDWQ